MTERSDFAARLKALVEEARAAGVLEELRTVWRELEAPAPREAQEFPGRFGLVGGSAAMNKVFELIERVAQANVPVLVLGETGTGKELVARALHENSSRHAKTFLAENCAAVPATLLESELFGHKKGSFTGAIADRPGHFVAADGGTVFLDEIGDMPLEMQAKLLRVLQNGEVRPVGSNKVVKTDVRLVAATNKKLGEMAKSGAFREDLYYRLNVITIELPPLREREGDVERLARFILQKLGEEHGRAFDLSPEALAVLNAWRWPGNVRELENELQRAAVFSSGAIQPADLSPRIREGSSS